MEIDTDDEQGDTNKNNEEDSDEETESDVSDYSN